MRIVICTTGCACAACDGERARDREGEVLLYQEASDSTYVTDSIPRIEQGKCTPVNVSSPIIGIRKVVQSAEATVCGDKEIADIAKDITGSKNNIDRLSHLSMQMKNV